MPFESRDQQQWYYATDQDYLDDEPHEARKVKGEAEYLDKDLTTTASPDIDPNDKNLETPVGSAREVWECETCGLLLKSYENAVKHEKKWKHGTEENPNHDSKTGQFTSGSGSSGKKLDDSHKKILDRFFDNNRHGMPKFDSVRSANPSTWDMKKDLTPKQIDQLKGLSKNEILGYLQKRIGSKDKWREQSDIKMTRYEKEQELKNKERKQREDDDVRKEKEKSIRLDKRSKNLKKTNLGGDLDKLNNKQKDRLIDLAIRRMQDYGVSSYTQEEQDMYEVMTDYGSMDDFSDKEVNRIIDLATRRMQDSGIDKYDKKDQKLYSKAKDIFSKTGKTYGILGYENFAKEDITFGHSEDFNETAIVYVTLKGPFSFEFGSGSGYNGPTQESLERKLKYFAFDVGEADKVKLEGGVGSGSGSTGIYRVWIHKSNAPIFVSNVNSEEGMYASIEGYENVAKEEATASVSGPPSDSTMNIMSDDVLVQPNGKVVERLPNRGLAGKTRNKLPKRDLARKELSQKPVGESLLFEGYEFFPAKKGHMEKVSDIVFEGRLYTCESLGNCEFCGGKGKITVERLGLKECPDCDGTGNIQQAQPDLMQQMDDPSQQMGDPMQQTGNSQFPQQPKPTQNKPEEKPQIEEKHYVGKTCPKCHNDNTSMASKLGMYAGSRFCKDCAIYYNQDGEAKSNESFSDSWECVDCDRDFNYEDAVDHINKTGHDLVNNNVTKKCPKCDSPVKEPYYNDDYANCTNCGHKFKWLDAGESKAIEYVDKEIENEPLYQHYDDFFGQLKPWVDGIPDVSKWVNYAKGKGVSESEARSFWKTMGNESNPNETSVSKTIVYEKGNKIIHAKIENGEKTIIKEHGNSFDSTRNCNRCLFELDNKVEGESVATEIDRCKYCKSGDISSDKYGLYKCNKCDRSFDIPYNEPEEDAYGDEKFTKENEEDDEWEEQMDRVCTKCGLEQYEHDGQKHEFSMRGEESCGCKKKTKESKERMVGSWWDKNPSKRSNVPNSGKLVKKSWGDLSDKERSFITSQTDPELYSSESKPKAFEASLKGYKSFIDLQMNVLKKKAKGHESVSLMYGLPTVQKQGKKIKGTLAYAGVSLNDRIYLPEELAKGHGKTLPLLLNHSSTAGAEDELYRLDSNMIYHLENDLDYQVGEVTLTWDAEKLTLFYEGVIDHPFFQKEVDDMNMAVSLGIYYDGDSPQVCDEFCYTLIKGAEFREVSLVYHAGFPIATIEAVEAEIKRKAKKMFEAKAEEELDELMPTKQPVDVEEKPSSGDKITITKPNNDEKKFDTVSNIMVESLSTTHNFSIRGIKGMTISNTNGVEKYVLDPSMGFETNMVHFDIAPSGAQIFGEEIQIQPKMTTPSNLTSKLENMPDIKITSPDET